MIFKPEEVAHRLINHKALQLGSDRRGTKSKLRIF